MTPRPTLESALGKAKAAAWLGRIASANETGVVARRKS
jgi:hypothetical protein